MPEHYFSADPATPERRRRLTVTQRRHVADTVEVPLRVEVHDGGGPTGPRRRVHDIESMTGRGLDLFDALSDRWGVGGTPDGWTVWFELALAGQEASASK